MADYLADSNVIILYLNNAEIPSSVVHILKSKRIAISAITKLELLGWDKISEAEIAIITMFLNSINIIQIDENIINNSILIKRQSRIKTPDSIIAATCIVNKLPLITFDKDFNKITTLEVINI